MLACTVVNSDHTEHILRVYPNFSTLRKALPMEQVRIDGLRLLLLLIGVCLGMTLVATIALWSVWSPLIRFSVLVADVLWILGASRLVLTQVKSDSQATRSEAESVRGGAQGREERFRLLLTLGTTEWVGQVPAQPTDRE